MRRIYRYFINLDERGEFYADIRDASDNTVLEIDTDYARFLSDERVNVYNVSSLLFYFQSIGDLPQDAFLFKGN